MAAIVLGGATVALAAFILVLVTVLYLRSAKREHLRAQRLVANLRPIAGENRLPDGERRGGTQLERRAVEGDVGVGLTRMVEQARARVQRLADTHVAQRRDARSASGVGDERRHGEDVCLHLHQVV